MNDFEEKLYAAVFGAAYIKWKGYRDAEESVRMAHVDAYSAVSWHRSFIDKGGSIFNEDLEDLS